MIAEGAVADGAVRPPIELTLVVDGASEHSARAIAHTHRICAAHLPADHVLRVVDIREPGVGTLGGGLLTAPMLVRRRPLPVRRIAGDLSGAARVLAALDLA